jgi:aspartate dehydrogenase
LTKWFVGLVGCGFIGANVAKLIDEELKDSIELRFVYDEIKDKAEKLSHGLGTAPAVAYNPDILISDRAIGLIIEAASQDAVRSYVPKALRSGKNVLIMSVGALADTRLYDEIVSIAREKGLRVFIPSGAIGGLDWIKAAAQVGLEKVMITVRKPPAGLEGSPYVIKNRIDLRSIREPTQIYEGPASDAASAFPANVNVAVSLALAGMGMEKTLVRVVADPTSKRNVHEITAEGAAGKITVRVENLPAPTNPKTSWVAALSAAQKVKGLVEPISLG